MKVFTNLLAAVATANTATAIMEPELCGMKNANVGKAIEAFCAKTNIVVPSNYASKGYHVGTGGRNDITIAIDGSCSPAQWVPQKYCKSQFYWLCATGDSKGGHYAYPFGRGGCQSWSITRKPYI